MLFFQHRSRLRQTPYRMKAKACQEREKDNAKAELNSRSPITVASIKSATKLSRIKLPDYVVYDNTEIGLDRIPEEYYLEDVLGGGEAYEKFYDDVEKSLDSRRKKENMSLRCVREWLHTFLNNCIVDVNKEPEYLAALPQLMCSGNQVPDLTVSSDGYVVLIIEVYSGSEYDQSLKLCAIRGIDLVRYYNNFDKDVTLTTILLPKSGPHSEAQKTQKKTLASKVVVKFDFANLEFDVKCEPILNLEDVKGSIEDSIRENDTSIGLGRMLSQSRTLYSIPLSRAFHLFKENSADISVEQIETVQPVIIIQNGKGFFKFFADSDTRSKMSSLTLLENRLREGGRHHQVLLPSTIQLFGHLHFFQYDLLLPHKSRRDVKQVPLFAEKVATAMDYLHVTIKVAHLDIRRQNVCYRDDLTPVLVDLDQYESVNKRANLYINRKTVMLCPSPSHGRFFPSHWTTGNLDWRQYGIMLWDIQFGSEHTDYHNMDLNSITHGGLKDIVCTGKS